MVPEEPEVQDLETQLDINTIRKYELDKLKYYYSVLKFDSSRTADHIYTTLNDFEIQGTGNKMDLRAIPDDLKVPRKPVDVCKDKPTKISNLNFLTAAKTNTRVEVSWEKPNKGNKNSVLFETDLDNNGDIDIRDFIDSDDLGSDSDDSGDGEGADAEEARAQLLGSKNRGNLFSDFDKSNKKGMVDVKFKAGFEALMAGDESSSEEDTDK